MCKVLESNKVENSNKVIQKSALRKRSKVINSGFIKTTDYRLPTQRPLTTYPPTHQSLTHQFRLKQKTRS